MNIPASMRVHVLRVVTVKITVFKEWHIVVWSVAINSVEEPAAFTI